MSLQVKRLKAFTLLEVIVAMAMFAMIAAPTLSLMSLAARKTGNQIGAANASELKRKIESAVANSVTISSLQNAFSWDLAGNPVALYASRDLVTIEYSGNTTSSNDKYYRIDILDPSGYIYDNSVSSEDAYRVFVFKVVWPAYIETAPGTYVDNLTISDGDSNTVDPVNSSGLEEMILTSVVSK